MLKKLFFSFLIIFATLILFECLSAFEKPEVMIAEFTFKDEEVIVVSKSKELVSSAPSIVSVITKDDIKSINPRNLIDILNMLPGFNYHTRNLGETLFQFRGISSVHDGILFMIDGHPLSDRIFGTSIYVISSIPVEEIEKIEIIRGPGSSIYGANAFFGVVNIITTSEKHNKEIRAIGKFGSEKTVNGTMMVKREYENKNRFIATASVFDTDGPKMDFIDRSSFQGKTFYEQTRYHLYANAQKGNLGFSGMFNKEELGPYIGISYYLNDRTLRKYTTGALEIRDTHFLLNNKVEVSSKISYDTFIYDCFWEYKPPRLLSPNGYVADAYARDYSIGTDLNAKVKFSDRHRLLAGATYNYLGLTDSKASHNVDTTDFYKLVEMKGSWISNGNENNYAVYFQDNYFITKSIQAVLGMRYDNHTAYGDSWNPRCALTMGIGKISNIKILYGQAFRAPNFWDLYSNSPDLIRNPDLKPEEIQTYEGEVNILLPKYLQAKTNYFHSDISNLIETVPVTAQAGMKRNIGKIKVDGIEAELRGNIFRGQHYFILNWFYSKSKDANTGKYIPFVPDYGSSCIINNVWNKYFNTNIQVKYVGSVRREEIDTRPALSPTTLVNLASSLMIYSFSLKGTVYNVFNAAHFSPSPYKRLPKSDYPHSGRTFIASLEYKY